jgi:hypothetical protein
MANYCSLCITTGKQKITDQIALLKYKEPNSPKIVVLEQELVRAEAESLVAEAQLSNITREKLKAAFTYQFDALKEHCEKLAIIAGYGKHLLELVDDTPVTPGETRNAYDGYEASKAYVPLLPTLPPLVTCPLLLYMSYRLFFLSFIFLGEKCQRLCD